MNLHHIKPNKGRLLIFLFVAAAIQPIAFGVNASVRDIAENESLLSAVSSGDRVISGEELKKASLTDWWEALCILEPSLFDETKQIYGDTPGYMPASVDIRGKSHWLMNADQTSLPLFVIDGARVPVRQMMNININDIGKVVVYKDPVSLSKYGINGSNGVIEIITRKPVAGKIKVSYMFDGIFQKADLSTQKSSPEFVGNKVNTDWLKVPLHTGFQNRHKLDIEGGDDYVKYKFSARLSPGGSGVMKGSKNDIFGLNSYIEYNMKALHISNDIVFNQYKTNASNYGTYDYFRFLNPEWKATDSSGIPRTTLVTSEGENIVNPVYEATLNSFDETKTYEVYDNLNVRLDLKNGLSANGSFAFIRETTRHDIYLSPSSGIYSEADAGSNSGRYDVLRDNTLSFEGSFSLNYGARFGKSDFAVSGGIRAFNGKYYDETYAGIGIPTDRMAYISFTKSYDTEQKPEAHRSYDHTLQAIAMANYSYDNRYSITGSVNLNRSSRLSPGKRNACFYGIGLNWNIHNESFLKDTNIKRLALSAAIGTTGGIGFDDNDYNVTYASNIGNEYIYNYYLIGSAIRSMPNKDIKWHTVNNMNLDLFFDYSRISLKLSWYNNMTTDALVFARLPLSTGWDYTISNGGKINNSGIEFRVGANILENENGWSLSAFTGGAYNRNRINTIPEYFMSLYNNHAGESNALNTGTYRFVSELSEGHSIDGGMSPEFGGNLGASLQYKEWWLNAIFNYTLGGKCYNWFETDESYSSRYIDNNEFRLSSLQLGYTFASELCKKIRISNMTLALSANNLIRHLSSGIENGILYPAARTMAVSLRITF